MIDPEGFLMIEPAHHPLTPIVYDEITAAVREIYSTNRVGHGYHGKHQCICGAVSDASDHYVTIGGAELLTNSLAEHYVSHHRDEIPIRDMRLIRFYINSKTPA